MISRTWHGMVPLRHKDGFAAYLNQTGVRDALAICGNRGAYIKVVDQDGYSHFFLCTIWASWDDVIAYAGHEPHLAITYPEDALWGLVSDPIVVHQTVAGCENPFIKYTL